MQVGMLHKSVRRGEQAMPRFERHNKGTYSWEPDDSRTNTELEFGVTRSGENVSTGQTTSAKAPCQRRSQLTNNMYC